MRILGIDPGSHRTGFGIIDIRGREEVWVAHGCLEVKEKSLGERLRGIFEGMRGIIQDYGPREVAVESVFFHRYPEAALKLGQARGVVLCAAALAGLPIFEYPPSSVKQAIVGKGNAGKGQMQYMVGALLNLPKDLQPDAADALAVALCHGRMR